MTLSEELSWRGFVGQTTFSNISDLDKRTYRFYWGVDPSSDSMTVGNLAMAMMVKHFINYGHQAFILVGGATGMIGDPDGKSEERKLLSIQDIKRNKQSLAQQYRRLFDGNQIQIVDNYDWFKNFEYLDFLRNVGKHVPLSQMLGREFVQTRLGKEGNGISYAEFSYVLIQAYDFYYLHDRYNVDLQVCGADQWGNSIAGIELIRRLSGDSAQVWAGPLVVNPQTKVKFGKSEEGAIWLDPAKTSPTAFYQFWVNAEDSTVGSYLKMFTLLDQDTISKIIEKHLADPKLRLAQYKLADEVTAIVHGPAAAELAKSVTEFLVGSRNIGDASRKQLDALRNEIPSAKAAIDSPIVLALVASGLATSNTVARKLLQDGAIYIDNKSINRDKFLERDFNNGRLLLRRGKAYKDSALIELLS